MNGFYPDKGLRQQSIHKIYFKKTGAASGQHACLFDTAFPYAVSLLLIPSFLSYIPTACILMGTYILSYLSKPQLPYRIFCDKAFAMFTQVYHLLPVSRENRSKLHRLDTGPAINLIGSICPFQE